MTQSRSEELFLVYIYFSTRALTQCFKVNKVYQLINIRHIPIQVVIPIPMSVFDQ